VIKAMDDGMHDDSYLVGWENRRDSWKIGTLSVFYGVRQARQPEPVIRFSHWETHWHIGAQPMG